MTRSKLFVPVTAVLMLGVWNCGSERESRAPATRTTSTAETAIDWRYGPCPENSDPVDPSRCGFPPGAARGTLTTYDEAVTCASLGIGSTATAIDPLYADPMPGSSEGLIAGRQFDLVGGNKVILWMPEGWFWASSTALDAVIVRFTADGAAADAGKRMSFVYRYVPAAFASDWIAGYGTWSDENGVPYRSTGIEFCYTLAHAQDDAGSPPSSDDDAGAGGDDSKEGEANNDAVGGGKTW